MFDPTAPTPPGVTIFYNTHEPVYTGELAERVKAEIRRRMQMRGSYRPNGRYEFSGLLLCAECGYRMAWLYSNGYKYARCNVAYGSMVRSSATCSQRRQVSVKYARRYFAELIRRIIDSGDVVAFLHQLSNTPEPPDETPLLQSELNALEEDARLLIQKQLRATEALADLYQEQIDVLGQRMETVRARLSAAQRANAKQAQQEEQRQGVEDIRALGDGLWGLAARRN